MLIQGITKKTWEERRTECKDRNDDLGISVGFFWKRNLILYFSLTESVFRIRTHAEYNRSTWTGRNGKKIASEISYITLMTSPTELPELSWQDYFLVRIFMIMDRTCWDKRIYFIFCGMVIENYFIFYNSLSIQSSCYSFFLLPPSSFLSMMLHQQDYGNHMIKDLSVHFQQIMNKKAQHIRFKITIRGKRRLSYH